MEGGGGLEAAEGGGGARLGGGGGAPTATVGFVEFGGGRGAARGAERVTTGTEATGAGAKGGAVMLGVLFECVKVLRSPYLFLTNSFANCSVGPSMLLVSTPSRRNSSIHS